MSKNLLLPILFFSAFQLSVAQTEPYKIFDSKGKEVTFENIVKDSKKSEVIFFGELHNNSIAHWLQLQLLKNLHVNGNKVILAGEFFERDDQMNIDEWFDGKLTDKNFEAEAKLWNNYQVDYKPLMLYAKKNNIPFVATNVPRKYASMVSRKGLSVVDSLSEEAKKSIATLPIEVDKTLPGYVGMKDMMHGSGMNAEFMVEAQALKDATMAYSLFDYLEKGNSILHINGSYHSNNYEGIIWYVQRTYSKTKIMTISTVEQESIQELEDKSKGIADYIIVLPTDSPKSY
jgi:uncharacterized iron-regulated protein